MNFLLLAIYISLYYIRPFEWVAGCIGVPLLSYVGIIAFIAILQTAISGNYSLFFSGDTERMMWFFWLAICLSQISHFYFAGFIKSFNVFQPAVIVFFLILTSINSKKQLYRFILLLICLSSFLAYEGIIQYTTGFAHGGMVPLYETTHSLDGEVGKLARIRWYGVFNDPNDLGMLFVIVIPFLIDMTMNRHFLIPLICFPLITTALYYTNSRGSILAGIISIGGYFVLRYRSIRGLMYGSVLAIIVLVLAPGSLKGFSAEEDSAYGRIDSWYAGYQMFKENPLFGVGQGLFTDFNDLTAHNSFVLVMAETGFLGLFFFTGLVYYPLYWLYISFLKAEEEKYKSKDIGLISSIYGSLLGTLASMFFLSRAYMLVPYMLIALAVVVCRIIEPRNEIRGYCIAISPHNLKNIFFMTLSQIIFIFIFVKIFI